MLENNFITFDNEEMIKCGFVKPIGIGESFILQKSRYGYSLSIVDEDGNTYEDVEILNENYDNYIVFTIDLIDEYGNVPYGKCVYIKRSVRGGVDRYSQPMYFVDHRQEDLDVQPVYYRCNEDAFGWPFSQFDDSLCTWIPVNLKNPQYKQEDKTYVKRDGEVVVLMAKHYKEWEAESEYMPEEMHESLIAALSCDKVLLYGGIRLTKSDSYSIDWENTIKKACGQKLAKATWKMRANIMERNSNC